jgi:hypothetical protein
LVIMEVFQNEREIRNLDFATETKAYLEESCHNPIYLKKFFENGSRLGKNKPEKRFEKSVSNLSRAEIEKKIQEVRKNDKELEGRNDKQSKTVYCLRKSFFCSKEKQK